MESSRMKLQTSVDGTTPDEMKELVSGITTKNVEQWCYCMYPSVAVIYDEPFAYKFY
ncbi:unnamed protein product [Gongylonema pulchrum]|uniref:DUF4242 domain-containing protein n=1 Tax=Gongylonema pulchrum TaxID=637853 RepID=A0A183DGB9_9BILA|nr:unnamed protein product [Gongylonema pulchrum]